jgi:hypothetical protein
MSETDWKAVHRMEAAADRASQAAQQSEEAARRIAHLLEDGYGGNGLRLIEALEGYNAEQKQQHQELLAALKVMVLWATDESIPTREVVEQARTAIAKAEA